MKVIFFTTESSNLPGARRCYAFSKGLAKKGIKTEVISCAEYLNTSSLKKLYINDIKKILIQIKIYKRIFKEKDTIFYLQRVNYHCLAPLLIKKLYGNKIILDIDDWSLDANVFRGLSLFNKYKIKNLTVSIINNCFACITISKKLEKFIRQYSKKVFYIPVLTEVAKDTFIAKKNNDFVFSWIGTVYREDDLENIKFIIGAFNEFMGIVKKKNMYLDILGGGPLFDKLKKVNHGENVRIKDWIDQLKINDYLSKIKVGLIPLMQDSYYNKYKIPTKLFDYMAINKAVITSDIGETGFFVNKNKCGFALPNIKKTWIDHMCLMYNDPKLLKGLSDNGYKLIKDKYSLNKSVNTLYNIIMDIYDNN